MASFSTREEYLAWKAAQTRGTAPTDTAATRSSTPAAPPPPLDAVKPKKGFREAFTGLPAWAWLFIIGCAAIPIVSLGGAIPGALGFGAAAGCANLAKREKWPVGARVLACAALAGGAWMLFLAFAVGMAMMQH